jgi:hypothetical protein
MYSDELIGGPLAVLFGVLLMDHAARMRKLSPKIFQAYMLYAIPRTFYLKIVPVIGAILLVLGTIITAVGLFRLLGWI